MFSLEVVHREIFGALQRHIAGSEQCNRVRCGGDATRLHHDDPMIHSLVLSPDEQREVLAAARQVSGIVHAL